ncbi:MAG: tRNA epoxyqueuosine(34) reductase QueG [Defluviicoccus sp.]
MPPDKERIRAEAFACGFDAVGFAGAAGDPRDAENLATYVAQGRHGDMAWLARESPKRADPARLWPAARSVICLGLNYGPETDPLAGLGEPGVGWISIYARRRDYHLVLKKKLKRLGRWLVRECGGDIKVFVDTAPVMEKPLAARAGLGWIGKHTNLVSRRFGSWLFLGEVFTTLAIEPDAPAADACGRCTRCIEACPTGALDQPYRIDPLRCLSYLTIEHKGNIAGPLADALSNRLFGCDDCLAVCPWNKFAEPARDPELTCRTNLECIALDDIASLDDAAFRARFIKTPVRRAGRERLQYAASIARSNAHPPHASAAKEDTDEPTSRREPAPTGSEPPGGGHSGSA